MTANHPFRRLERLFYCLISAIVLFALPARCADPARTIVSDTLYRADGAAARGTLLIAWPAFSTADGKPVAAGTLSVKIGVNGSVNIPLIPTQGATPSGTAYRVVISLDDGSSNTEYWSIPTLSPTTIAAIRSTQVPTTVAMQVVSREYVDQQLATAVRNSGDQTITGAKTFTSSPLVPTPGTDAAAATKGYVDTAIAAAAPSSSNVLNINKGGTGTNSFTPARCVRVADDGNSLESSATDCGGANADTVDGLHASAFLGATAKAADSDMVDGKHASDLTNATQLQGTAVDTAAPQRGQQPYFDASENKIRWRSAPHLDLRDFGAKCDNATDDTVAIQAAVNAASAASGAAIYVSGFCRYTYLDARNTHNVNFVSFSGNQAAGATLGGNAALVCTRTDDTRCIDARSSFGFVVDGVSLLNSSNSFTGYIIDFGHSPVGGNADSAYMRLENLSCGGTAQGVYSANCVNFDDAIIGYVDHVFFRFLNGGVLGFATYGNYANVFTITNNTFLWIGTYAIRNPAQSWTVSGNTFEGCQPNAMGPAWPCALDYGPDVTGVSANAENLNYVNNWHEGGMGTLACWVCRVQATAVNFQGNFFGGASGNANIADIASNNHDVTVTLAAPASFKPGAAVDIQGVAASALNKQCVIREAIGPTQFKCYMQNSGTVPAQGAGGIASLKTVGILVYPFTTGLVQGNSFGAANSGGVGIANADPNTAVNGAPVNVTVINNITSSGARTLIDPQNQIPATWTANSLSFATRNGVPIPNNTTMVSGSSIMLNAYTAESDITWNGVMAGQSIDARINLSLAAVRFAPLPDGLVDGDKLALRGPSQVLGARGYDIVVTGPSSLGRFGIAVDPGGTQPATNGTVVAGMKADGTLFANAPTGTAPLTITSSTPVANLTAANHPTMQSCGATADCAHSTVANSQIVRGTVALSGGTATVTGIAPAFTSTTTYNCTATDESAPNAVQVVRTSASSITLNGTATDVIGYICAGN